MFLDYFSFVRPPESECVAKMPLEPTRSKIGRQLERRRLRHIEGAYHVRVFSRSDFLKMLDKDFKRHSSSKAVNREFFDVLFNALPATHFIVAPPLDTDRRGWTPCKK